MATFYNDSRRIHVGYSTNVHRAESMEEVHRYLNQTTSRIRDGFMPPGRPMGIDLRLGSSLVRELTADPRAIDTLRRRLEELNLYVFGINGFPLGDFQAPVVKEAAYRPSWAHPDRLADTIAMGSILARLLPEGVGGSISTVAGGYRPLGDDPATRDIMAEAMVRAAKALSDISLDTGRIITLSPEPEPDTTMEDLSSMLSFYRDHIFPQARRLHARGEDIVHRHLPVTLDACHLSVVFEDPRDTIRALQAAGIRIGKSNITCCPAVLDPAHNPEGRRFLAALNEPRFLHQTRGRDKSGSVPLRLPDLDAFQALRNADLEDITEVRTHFHVPLFGKGGKGFSTTHEDTGTFLRALLELTGCESLAVETYTWNVFGHTPLHEAASSSLDAGLQAELGWTRDRLEEAGWEMA